MALDFPNNPTLGQTFAGPGGVIWTWDNVKWVGGGGSGSGGGSSSVVVSPTPPASPTVGQLWWDSTGGQLYIRYEDPNTQQWVTTHNIGFGVPLNVTNGGTGIVTYSQGDLIYGSAPDTLARLTKSTAATRYLANTGASNNPAWDQINLANGVAGLLPIANGGTGASTAAAAPWVEVAGDTMTGKLTTTQLQVGTGSGTPWDIHVAKSGGSAVVGIANTGAGAGAVANFFMRTGAAGDKSVSFYIDDANTTHSITFGTALTAASWYFNSNGAQKVFDSNGQMSVTAPAGQSPALRLNGSRSWTVNVNNANGDFYVFDNTAGAVRIDITPTGACWNATGTWGAMSDERTKRDVQPYRTPADCLASIIQLEPVMFKYNGMYGTVDDDQQMYGLIAQQVQPVMPELVTVRTVDDTEMLGVDIGRLMYAVINSLKEIEARLATLEGGTPAL